MRSSLLQIEIPAACFEVYTAKQGCATSLTQCVTNWVHMSAYDDDSLTQNTSEMSLQRI